MTRARLLRVGVAELRRRLGTRKPFHEQVSLDDLHISTAEVPRGALIDVDLELESISNGLVAAGSITAPWTGECRRCLDTVEGTVETEVKEIFERHPTEGETYPLGDDFVDLEPMVRDAVLLALPLAPLCRPDCAGPAPDQFPARVDDDESGGPDEDEARRLREERWGALDQLRFGEER